MSKASNPVSWSNHIGGVGANVAFAAARQIQLDNLNNSSDTDTGIDTKTDSESNSPTGSPVDQTARDNTAIYFCAAVGEDEKAQQLESALQAHGINTTLVRFPDTITGRYSAIMTHDGELYIGLADTALAEKLETTDLPAISKLADFTAVLVEANLSQNCLNEFTQLAKENHIPIAALSVSPSKTDRLLSLASRIDLLFCNRKEALAMSPALTPTISLDLLADTLQAHGFSSFVLTDGKEPLICQDDTGRHNIAVPPVNNTYSVNGAGDALAGATFAAWASGMTLTTALEQYGLPAASEVVSGQLPAKKLR